MPLSDQHPYAQYLTYRFHSVALSQAHLEVGDNANALFASVDIVSF